MKITWVLCLLAFGLASAEDDDEVQTEFYLPYSVSEDVDFSLSKPGPFGCYQWSTDAEDVVALEPVVTDFDNMCGSRLEFKIVKNNGKPTVDFKIKAENVDVASSYDNAEVPASFEFTIHVRPLAKLEVLGLKTELTAGSDSVPFGVAGYDAEDNEFDTLDGLQLTWFIGSKREIAVFEQFRALGPIVKVLPVGQGKGAVIATVQDSNYEAVQPAYMEFSVKSNLVIEPDGAYLLEGGNAQLQLFEISGIKDKNGNPTRREIQTVGEDADFTFEVKEPEYLSLDKASNKVTAMKLGETTVLLKNAEGEIVKGMPLRIVKAHHVTVTAEPNPESRQLILDEEYTIKINLFTKDERKIYPSENILCKTTFPTRQLEILHVTENGLKARVKAINKGLGKLKASLRSVLTPDDEEIEIIPHLKGSTDFEVYEQVTIKPLLTVLPWDDNVKPNYTLNYQASGGGAVYSYSVSNEEAASVSNEGRVLTNPTGAVSFKTKAFMPKSLSNFAEAQVHILPPTHVEIETPTHEFGIQGSTRVNVRFYTMLPDSHEKEMFTDCGNVPYEVKFSDPENFEAGRRSTLGNPISHKECANFEVTAKKAGVSTKITVAYVEPSSGRVLRAHTTIKTFNPLEVQHPKRDPNASGSKYKMLLAIGSTGKLILTGGPQPWQEKPSAHFKHIEVEDSSVIKATHVGASTNEDGTYKDEHVYAITCLKEGQSEVAFTIGNNQNELNMKTARDERLIDVECAMPQKLTFKYQHEDETAQTVVKKNKIMAHNNKNLKLTLTVKDKEGKTFTNTDSLKFETKVSDESLLEPMTPYPFISQVPLSDKFSIDGRPQHILKAKGKNGEVELKVKLAGYNQDVLDKAGVQNPPALPKVIDDDEDMDYEDEEDFAMHAHHLLDEVSLHLVDSEEIAKASP